MAANIWTNAARYIFREKSPDLPVTPVAPIAHSPTDHIIRHGWVEIGEVSEMFHKLPIESQLKMAADMGLSLNELFGALGDESLNRKSDMLKYIKVWAVHRAISIKAGNIAKIPWNVYRGNPGDEKNLVQNTLFHQLMQEPSKGWTARRLLYALLADWELVGDAYLEVKSRQGIRSDSAIEPSRGNPIDVILRQAPHEVKPESNADGMIDHWVVNDKKFELWQICNLSTYSPTNPMFGHSHTQSGASLVNSLEHVMVKIAQYFKEEYQQSGYLSTPERLTKSDFTEIHNQQVTNKGARRQGNIPVFSQGLTWNEFGSDKESKLIDAIDQLSKLVGRSYGISDGLMGFEVPGSEAKQRELRKVLYEDTLDPIVTDFQEQLTRFARKYELIAADEVIWFEIGEVINNLRDKNSIDQRAIARFKNYGTSYNEYRHELELPPIPETDERANWTYLDLQKDLVTARAVRLGSAEPPEVQLISGSGQQKQTADDLAQLVAEVDPLHKKKDRELMLSDGPNNVLSLDPNASLSTPTSFLNGGSNKEKKSSGSSGSKKKHTGNG